MALTVASLLKWDTFDLYLSSNVTHHSIGNKKTCSNFHLFPTFNTQHCMSRNCSENAANICGSYWHLRLNCDCQRGTQWIAKLKTVYSSIRCVCVCVCVWGMPLWLREVKWLNYTPEVPVIARVFLSTLIISEYTKHIILSQVRT